MKNIFYKIVIFAFLLTMLCGCAKKDPVENIADLHTQHISDVLDYSYNNIEQTKDVVFLENDVRYWRLATFGLFVLLCGAVFALIKRWFL